MDNVKINSKQQVVNFFMKDLEEKYPNALSLYKAIVFEGKRVYIGVIEKPNNPKCTFIVMDIVGSGDLMSFKPIASFGAEVMFDIHPKHFDVTAFKSIVEQCLHNCVPATIESEPLVSSKESVDIWNAYQAILDKMDKIENKAQSESISSRLDLSAKDFPHLMNGNEQERYTTKGLNLQNHYNNDNGSLYKIQQQRNWNSYLFDVVKRLERFDKKDQPIVEILKSIGVLALQIQEQDLFIGDSHEELINKTLIALHKVLHPQLIVFTQQELDAYIEGAIKAYEDGKKVAQSYQGGN